MIYTIHATLNLEEIIPSQAQMWWRMIADKLGAKNY